MDTKKIPMFLMLIAGAATSIVPYLKNYELKTMLTVLLVVLILFYILGLIVKKLFDFFEIQSKPKKEEEGEAEGEVIEKEATDAENDKDGKKAQDEK